MVHHKEGMSFVLDVSGEATISCSVVLRGLLHKVHSERLDVISVASWVISGELVLSFRDALRVE